VACLQALSKRIHYGKFVAESKYQEAPHIYDGLIAAQDAEGIDREITHGAVEEKLFERVSAKSESHSSLLLQENLADVFTDAVTGIYRTFIVPLTKVVEVDYLLQRQ